MNEFKSYHPIVNFIYFAFVIVLTCLFMHPLCIFASLLAAVSYMIMLKGKKALKVSLLYVIPMLIFVALLNPLFNHRGVTILAYLPSGNPLTLESIIYGFAAVFMMASVICHFFSFSEVLKSDKIIYLFGKIVPTISLIFSMTLKFVPMFIKRFKTVADAQKCIGKDASCGKFSERFKNTASVFSSVVTWALENSVQTADSLKSRGYGLKGRTSFSLFRFDKRDLILLIFLLLSGGYVVFGACIGAVQFSYYPEIKAENNLLFSLSVILSYLLLCFIPVIIELLGVMRWKAIKLKT